MFVLYGQGGAGWGEGCVRDCLCNCVFDAGRCVRELRSSYRQAGTQTNTLYTTASHECVHE